MINPELEFELEISPEALAPQGYHVRWYVSERLSYFDGHFPGFPVLPGIATVDVTLEALRRALHQTQVRLVKLQNAKFLHPIRPGNQISIHLAPLPTHLPTLKAWKAEWRAASGELVAELTLGIGLNG